MFYSDEIIEEVRARNDILDVISPYVSLKRKGSSYFGLCPFHNEKSGSFSVSPSKQMYYCFGCGAGGNVISFVMQYENLSFPEAVRFLAKRCGMSLPEQEYSDADRKTHQLREQLLEMHKLAATHYYQLLHTREGERAYQYLTGRGLSEETLRRFGLGYSSKRPGELYHFLKSRGYTDPVLKESGLVTIEERGARDKFWNRAMFPILDINSRVIGFGGRVMGEGEPKYLNSPETKLFDKSRNLYGLNYARSSRKDFFLLCEGYMDVISLHQAGFTNAVASLGTALTAQHCLLLKRYVKQVILTYDSDGAGQNAAKRALPLLRNAGINARVLSMKPYKDPDEFIKALGADAYQERIDAAKNAFLWEIDQLAKQYNSTDPAEKTAFYRECAGKLAEFSEPLERENYLQAVSREHMIPEKELRELVNRTGARVQLKQNYGRERYAVPNPGEKDSGSRRRKTAEPEDPVLKSQRLFLTLLAEEPELLKKTDQWVSPEHFTDSLYRELAEKLFLSIHKGNVNPGAILNGYAEDEEKAGRAAAVFHAKPSAALDQEEKEKALIDCIRNIRMECLNQASRSATTVAELQKILKEKAELKNTRIELRG